MTVYFFYEAGTVVCPRASNGGVSVFLRSRNRGMATGIFPLCNSRGKIPVAISRFLLREKKKSSDSPRFGLSCGDFAIVNSSLVTWLWLIHRDSRNLRELTRRRPRKISLCHVLINLKNVGVLGATDVV